VPALIEFTLYYASVVRYPSLTFFETAKNAWPMRHSCLIKCHNLQFNELFEMDWGNVGDSASDTSGGVPESDQMTTTRTFF
jgi:hypothetical protein